ncbi:unnamed protein product [Soboliphyme baturini]|uniref:Reverse transcriptase domain-containing protein n=1 Tax=Soboliphyme baturini TaxID=241478 RepID=A0A183J1Q2_9BILA|nr:unnamed protein product [Soboliphyme baturini]
MYPRVLITVLEFADDIALLSYSINDLVELTRDVCKVASAVGVEVSSIKIKIMRTPDVTNDPKIQWGETTLEEVENFKFLGSVLTRDGNCDMETLFSSAACRTFLKCDGPASVVVSKNHPEREWRLIETYFPLESKNDRKRIGSQRSTLKQLLKAKAELTFATVTTIA